MPTPSLTRRLRHVAVAVVLLGLVAHGDGGGGASPIPLPEQVPPTTYTNPVSTAQAQNPFILEHNGTYYSYASGYGSLKVPALTSTDMVTWTSAGDVLASGGAWASASPATRFSSPSVRYFPSNPTASKFVLYYTGTVPGAAGTKCIGVATSASPAGPFTGAASPLICPDGGAKDPSPVMTPGSVIQLIYKANTPIPGIYNQVLSSNGQAVNASIAPDRILRTDPGWWQEGIMDRPAIAFDPVDSKAYLFFRAGDPTTGVGWSPCTMTGSTLESCGQRTQFGTWIFNATGAQSPSGVQVFSDENDRQWITYSALPASTGTPTMRIDKLCFDHDYPRTNGPSGTSQTLARNADCSTDIPGKPLSVSSVVDDSALSQPSSVTFRDGGVPVPVSGRLLWEFSDSSLAGPCVNNNHGILQTNTSSWGIPNEDATGPGFGAPTVQSTPYGTCVSQFIPYTQAEIDYNNEQAWFGTGRRIVLWEQGGLTMPDGRGLVFFVKLIHEYSPGPCQALGCYEHIGVGAAWVTAGAATVSRSVATSPVACNPTCLFGTSDQFKGGRPFIDDGYVYLYADGPSDGDGVVRLGRVPYSASSIQNRGSWQFRTTTSGTPSGTWSSNITLAGDQANLMRAAPLPVYNPYLDKFVNITGGGWFHDLGQIQTAPSPWGPWTAEDDLYDFNSMKCTGAGIPYGAVPTGPIDSRNGRLIRFTYARPGAGACPGQVRLVSVNLN